MTHLIRCDGCGRTCGTLDVTTVTVTREEYALGDGYHEYHYCRASDGGSVGCNQFIISVLSEIGDRMKARNEELEADRRAQYAPDGELD